MGRFTNYPNRLDRKHVGSVSVDQVALYSITQATTATFTDLYIRLTFLFFIQSGSKHVVTPTQELVGSEGDLLIFPPGSMVTMQNRPFLNRSYHAVGVSFPDEMVREVFSQNSQKRGTQMIQHVPRVPHSPSDLLPILRDTLTDNNLPDVIQRHRFLEPLLWLRQEGYHLPVASEETPLGRVRRLIENDLTREWRAKDVAKALGMSEPTMRRWLAASGHGFSKILLHTRLENGLTLLQTGTLSISTIAMECGFKTPSHFSDAFRKRFGIRPGEIRSVAH